MTERTSRRFKKALVTGGAGFIGSRIVRRLLDRGIEVSVIDDLSMGRIENVPQGVEFLKASILDVSALRRAVAGADVVFHNAARVSIRDSFDSVYHDAETNVMGTVMVLKTAGRAGIKKFIYASSMAVYSDREPKPLKEEAMLEPLSPYGTGKLAGEFYTVQMGRHYGFDTVALRYFNTFGPGQTFTPYVGVITIFINELLHGRRPVIFGSGEQSRDFVYVEDVAEANIRAMESSVSGCAINVGTGRPTTVNDVARLLIEKLSPGMEPEYGPPREGEPGDSFADTERIKEVLGFVPPPSLEERIDEVIEWNRVLMG